MAAPSLGHGQGFGTTIPSLKKVQPVPFFFGFFSMQHLGAVEHGLDAGRSGLFERSGVKMWVFCISVIFEC